jgi:energy-coupling factor transporter ATP-binding protein EcfA2
MLPGLSNRIPTVVSKFEQGSELLVVATPLNYLERPQEEHQVKQVFGNTEELGNFNLITGEHGTGKSTLVKLVN